MESLQKQIDAIKDELNKITVKNGGNRPVTYERKDFHQRTYDILHLKGFFGLFIKAATIILIILQILNLLK